MKYHQQNLLCCNTSSIGVVIIITWVPAVLKKQRIVFSHVCLSVRVKTLKLLVRNWCNLVGLWVVMFLRVILKCKLWFSGRQISWVTDWWINWLSDWVYNFLHGLAQQWRLWKKRNLAQGSQVDEDYAETSNTCVAQRKRTILHLTMNNNLCSITRVLSSPCQLCELIWWQDKTVFSSLQYIWDWTVATWKLGPDKTKLSSHHILTQDKTVLSPI